MNQTYQIQVRETAAASKARASRDAKRAEQNRLEQVDRDYRDLMAATYDADR